MRHSKGPVPGSLGGHFHCLLSFHCALSHRQCSFTYSLRTFQTVVHWSQSHEPLRGASRHPGHPGTRGRQPRWFLSHTRWGLSSGVHPGAGGLMEVLPSGNPLIHPMSQLLVPTPLSGCLPSTEWLSAPAGIFQIAELPLRTTSLGIPWSTTYQFPNL